MSNLVEKYGVGVSIKGFSNTENKILNFMKKFNSSDFDINKEKLFKEIRLDNDIFQKMYEKFLSAGD